MAMKLRISLRGAEGKERYSFINRLVGLVITRYWVRFPDRVESKDQYCVPKVFNIKKN